MDIPEPAVFATGTEDIAASRAAFPLLSWGFDCIFDGCGASTTQILYGYDSTAEAEQFRRSYFVDTGEAAACDEVPPPSSLPKRKRRFPRHEPDLPERDFAGELESLRAKLSAVQKTLDNEYGENRVLRAKLAQAGYVREALEAVLETFSRTSSGWYQSVLVHPEDFQRWEEASAAVAAPPPGSVSA